MRDVAARLEHRGAGLEADVYIRDALHAGERFRDVLDAVGAGHALDADCFFQ